MEQQRINLDDVQRVIDSTEARSDWKGLEQIVRTEEHERWREDEFPHRKKPVDVDRRRFLQLMGASLALAGLGSAGCRRLPQEKSVPFVRAPEGFIHGVATRYASIHTESGYSTGVLVESFEGRPIRVDGNPNHPASRGALGIRAQASILDMYDPDRLKEVHMDGKPSTWEAFYQALGTRLDQTTGGEGFVVLSTIIGSPTLAALKNAFETRYPQGRWLQYEPVSRDEAFQATELVYGRPLEAAYQPAEARVLVSFDSRCFSHGPSPVQMMRDAMAARDLKTREEISRIYAFETTPTGLGAVADHRLPLKVDELQNLLYAVASRVGVAGIPAHTVPASCRELLEPLVADLTRHRGASLVLAGEHLDAPFQALALVINEALGNVGKTVVLREPVLPAFTYVDRNRAVLDELLGAGRVQTLLMLGGDPVYTGFADSDYVNRIAQVEFTAHLTERKCTTSELCNWALPQSHFLEYWADGVAFDGTVSIQQPLIEPLYDSRSELEVASALLGPEEPSLKLVQDYHRNRSQQPDGEFNRSWRRWLSGGVVSEATPQASLSTIQRLTLGPVEPIDGMTLVIEPDPSVYDGRQANNGWLRELPQPLTQLCWDNALLVSFATAKRLQLSTQDEVTLRVRERSVKAPVLVHMGQADDTLTAYLGLGQEVGGHIAAPREIVSGKGFNAYAVRHSANRWVAPITGLERTGLWPLALTQMHHTLDVELIDSGRNIVHDFRIDEYRKGERLVVGYFEKVAAELQGRDPEQPIVDEVPGPAQLPTLYSEDEFDKPEINQWGMTIDLGLCTGCNACVIACQAENNIPVVGKDQVTIGREMHWIRIDRYYKPKNGFFDPSNPATYFMPVNCMHCEKAPCEPVCPVAATVHSVDGLNQMIYNRCVGTRYCSNNCPYKVRRFNFLNYANHHDVPVLKMLNNPQVTVRGRGVMEKCTYCVQRISKARILAKRENRPLEGNEVRTACQAACPPQVIEFGDIRDRASKVAKNKLNRRNYELLQELNTRPRTSYLARVSNPSKVVG